MPVERDGDPATSSSAGLRHDAPIDLSNRNDSHTLLAEFVGPNRRVLDMGCAMGGLGRVLRQLGCEVVGVELDGTAAKRAEAVLDEVLVEDLEQLVPVDRFGPSSFDVVVFGDVLEHLRNPAIVLRRASEVLRPDGFVAISIPNVTHGAVRLALLAGRFDYRPEGLLDETHLRFFTRSSLQGLLAEAGFVAVQVERTRLGLFETEIELDGSQYPEELLTSLIDADEATTYQWVVKALRIGEVRPRPELDEVWSTPGVDPLSHETWQEKQQLKEHAERLQAESEKLAATLVRSVASSATLVGPAVGPDWSARNGEYRLDAAQDTESYRDWLEVTAGRRERERLRNKELLRTVSTPTISVLVPVYRPDHELLEKCAESVRQQDIEGWQLCLCDDGSGDPDLRAFLEGLARRDGRISVVYREENGGISAATNDAAERATGEFLALLDQDDELELGALAHVVLALSADPEIDFLYTDEDKLEPDGSRSEPFFKPDWSPDQLLSHMYTGHLFVVRRSLFEAVGGFRSDFDGSQDYDLALRVSERARKVVHLPVVAYHWRRIPGSTAQDYRAKPQADLAARAALSDALARREEQATVESGLHEGTFRVRRAIQGEPLVSVIVPFHNGPELLRRCVTSLQARAGYEHWEVILVDNRSWEPETRALLERLADDPRCRMLPYPQDFNWAVINNYAAAHCAGEHLVFMNADVEGQSEGWLAAMLEHSQRSEVGAVGARLLYPDGRVQHAGVVMGLGLGIASHAFCFCPGDQPGYFGQAKIVRNYSAVTGACMMTRREVFEAFGGFDEQLPVAYNDIDFCLRLREQGHRIVFTPFAELVHEESAARGHASREPIETAIMWDRWEACIRRDPYFNPNLDPRRSEWTLPKGLEDVDPWQTLMSSVERWLIESGRKWPTSNRPGRKPSSTPLPSSNN